MSQRTARWLWMLYLFSIHALHWPMTWGWMKSRALSMPCTDRWRESEWRAELYPCPTLTNDMRVNEELSSIHALHWPMTWEWMKSWALSMPYTDQWHESEWRAELYPCPTLTDDMRVNEELSSIHALHWLCYSARTISSYNLVQSPNHTYCHHSCHTWGLESWCPVLWENLDEFAITSVRQDVCGTLPLQPLLWCCQTYGSGRWPAAMWRCESGSPPWCKVGGQPQEALTCGLWSGVCWRYGFGGWVVGWPQGYAGCWVVGWPQGYAGCWVVGWPQG